jgi:hypothetical protein
LPDGKQKVRISSAFIQGILGLPELHSIDPVTGHSFEAMTFGGKLARRGSFDLSYLSDVVDVAFIRRHATSYALGAVPRASASQVWQQKHPILRNPSNFK